MIPWFHESVEPSLFNEWTWTHFAWGLMAKRVGLDFVPALIAHTVYEAVEGYLFPIEHRDSSMTNHVGDTIAFITGYGVGIKK